MLTTQDNKAASFVPELIKHALRRNETITPPFEMQFESVGLFADVSGFTKMTEKLAEMGNVGAEILAEKINAYLGQMVRKIQASGGDVVKFAGDALICTWIPNTFANVDEFGNEIDNSMVDEDEKKEELKKLSHLAVQVCVKIQKELGQMALEGTATTNEDRRNKRGKSKKEENPTLRVKLGVGVGKIRLLIVGGCLGRCEYLISGDGLMQAFGCENDCQPEEVIISKQVYQLVKTYFQCTPILNKDGNPTGNYNVNIHKTKKSIVARHAPNVKLTSQITDAFPKFIPSAVKPHLEMPSTFWSGELRDLTILFLSLPFDAKTLKSKSEKVFNQLQRTIKTLQRIVYRFQGSLNKFLVDDKGSTVMAVFGLPPVAHDNDSTRAVLAALDLREALKTKRETAAIGITSGTVFVGIIGGVGTRREYGVLGDKVNLAARLMSKAKTYAVQLGEVLVDKSVYETAKHEVRVLWKKLPAVEVKGKKGKIQIYRPVRAAYDITAYKLNQATNLETSDRSAINRVARKFDQFLAKKEETNGDSCVVMIEGEISMGKSSLLGLIQVVRKQKFWFVCGKADCFQGTMKMDYLVWRQILMGILQRFSLMLQKNRYKFLTYIKSRRPDLYDWVFLIGDVIVDLGNRALLQPPWSRNEQLLRTTKKSAIVRNRSDVIFCFIEWLARVKPIVVVIDELQWLTPRDWQMTRRFCLLVKKRILKNVFVLLGATPMDNKRYTPYFIPPRIVEQYTAIKNEYTDLVVEPQPWGMTQTQHFIKQSLKVYECTQSLTEVVQLQCGGRPGFCAAFLETLTKQDDEMLQDKDKTKSKKAKSEANELREGESFIEIVNYKHHNIGQKKQQIDKMAKFAKVIEQKLRIGADIQFPIPPFIQAVTAAHLDKLTPEQSLAMKTAAVICKAQGNSSMQFDEHMIRGTHPVPEKGFADKKRLRGTLKELCDMRFIRDLSPYSNKSSDNDIIRPAWTANGGNTSQYDHSSSMYGGGGGGGSGGIHSNENSNDYDNDEHHTQMDSQRSGSGLPRAQTTDVGSGSGSGAGAGAGGNNPNWLDELGSIGTMKQGKSVPSMSNSTYTNNGGMHKNADSDGHLARPDTLGITLGTDDINQGRSSGVNISNNLTVRSHTYGATERNENHDIMPTTASLMVAPVASVPYKRGVMWKRGKGFKGEQKRIFIFKHRTLYWIRADIQPPEYPQNYLRFDQHIKKLKPKFDTMTIKIQVPTKSYYLRCEKMEDLQLWFNLFAMALSEHYGNDKHGLAKILGNNKNKMKSSFMSGVFGGSSPRKRSNVDKMQQISESKNNNNGDVQRVISSGSGGLSDMSNIMQQVTNKSGSNVSTPTNGGGNINSSGIQLQTPTVDDSDTETQTQTNNGSPKIFSLTDDGGKEDGRNGAASMVAAHYVNSALVGGGIGNGHGYDHAKLHHEDDDSSSDEHNYDSEDDSKHSSNDSSGDHHHHGNNNGNNNNGNNNNNNNNNNVSAKSRLTNLANGLVKDVESLESDNFKSKKGNNKGKGGRVSTAPIGFGLIEEFDMTIDHSYEFNYGFLRDVLYEHMLHTQKKHLHIGAKKYLETLLSEQGYHQEFEKLVQRHTALAQSLSNHVQFNNPKEFTRADKRKSQLYKQGNGSLLGGIN